MSIKVKIVNDPVYGFIRFPEPELMQVIDHPWFQRLRSIKQMGLAQLVYPGAVHTRFAHSLGACHLMGKALDELKAKNITPDREAYLGHSHIHSSIRWWVSLTKHCRASSCNG
jgi:HD superfamily phosphohydrolase